MTQSPDLYALIIRLIAAQNGRLRATQGHLAHAAFLDILQRHEQRLDALLNQADLAPDTRLTTFDLINVPPTPLVRNGVMDGRFYQLDKNTHLPVGMRFGVESLV